MYRYICIRMFIYILCSSLNDYIFFFDIFYWCQTFDEIRLSGIYLCIYAIYRCSVYIYIYLIFRCVTCSVHMCVCVCWVRSVGHISQMAAHFVFYSYITNGINILPKFSNILYHSWVQKSWFHSSGHSKFLHPYVHFHISHTICFSQLTENPYNNNNSTHLNYMYIKFSV